MIHGAHDTDEGAPRAEVPMDDRWHMHTVADTPELATSPKPVVAQWKSGQNELTLYQEGTIETAGPVPVELLSYVMYQWQLSLRGRIM